MAVELVRPRAAFERSFVEGLRELESTAEREAWLYLGRDSDLGLPVRNFDAYVRELLRREDRPPPGFVPGLVWWAVASAGSTEVLGRIALRLELNDFLSRWGGHVGYIVRPSARRRGIATDMLRQVLMTPEAKAIGQLLVTCDEGNVASERTILRNGGVFEGLAPVGGGRPAKKRFWIAVDDELSRRR